MTIDEFRQDPAARQRMREIFDDPTFMQAIVLVQSANPVVDAPLGSPEIMSVRTLSRTAGHQGALEMLMSLAEPITLTADLGDPTFEPPATE